MIIKIILTQPTAKVPVNNQHYMNGFFHAIVGSENEWHDKFSQYTVSSLQGGHLNADKKTLYFEEYPYIMVSSENEKFLSDVSLGIMLNKEASVFGMKIDNVSYLDYKLNPYFDKVYTISPILLKKNGRKITVEDEGWIEELIEMTRRSLEYYGVVEPFNIEFYHKERAKKKMVYVGDIFNPCSQVGLKITGSKKVRKAIYNMGLGNSTGSGFGSIKIYEND